LTITVMEHSRFFCHMAIPIKLSRSITYFGTAEKVMPYHLSPNGFACGCSSAYATFWRYKTFNLHYFRPYLFWQYLKKSCLSHFPNKAQIFHYGNYLDFALKIAHRGNTGSHRGKRKLGCASEK